MRFQKSAISLIATLVFTASASTLLAEPAGSHHHSNIGKSWTMRSHNYYSNWNDVRKIRGVGTYVVASGINTGAPDLYIVKAPAPGVKIIDVATQFDPCSYEHGVCVIRGIED